jgi:hypothetical protein
MQLKDIAKGLREAATLLPSDPVYFSIEADKRPRCKVDPVAVKFGTLTLRILPYREAFDSVAAKLEAGGMRPTNPYYYGTVRYGEGIIGGRNHVKKIVSTPRRQVLQDFLASGEVENAQQYAELTDSEDILAELLK